MPNAPFLMHDGIAIPQTDAMRGQFVALQQAINAIRAVTGQPPISVDGKIGYDTAAAIAEITKDYGDPNKAGGITPAFIAGQAEEILRELNVVVAQQAGPMQHPAAAGVKQPTAAKASASPKRSPSSPLHRASTTQQAARSMVDKETNARFWAQTGYKVGQKLDLSNATDRAMAKVWNDIHAKVSREDAAGKLVLTYNHPAVEQHLEDASVANGAAIHHLDAAAAASTAEQAQSHIQAAATASDMAKQRASAAAAMQPAVVSPEATQAALDDVGASLSDPDVARQVAASAAEQVAITQAAALPSHSTACHIGTAVQPTIKSDTIANVRDRAIDLARNNGPFCGIAISPGGEVEVHKFGAREEMYAWYKARSEQDGTYKYIAMFDHDEGEQPAADLFGGSIAVSASAPAQALTVAPKKSKAGWIIAGIAAVVGVGAIAMASRKPENPAQRVTVRGKVAR